LEPTSIDRTLKIQVNCPGLSSRGYLFGQCRLADLAGSEQNHAGHVMEAILDEWSNSACQHIITGNITSNVNIPGYEGQALMRGMTAKRSGQHSAF
jgi:hypothetical protein